MARTALAADTTHDLLPHYWRNFLLLALDSGSFAFAVTALSHLTIIPSYLAQITDSRVLQGLAPTIYVLGSLLPQVLVANWANGLKRRKPYLLTVYLLERVGIALLYFITVQATGLSSGAVLAFFLCAYTVFATTLGLSSPVYTDFVAKAINVRRGLFFGFSYFLAGLSGVFSGRLAARTLNSLPFPESYAVVFQTALIVTVISLVFCLLLSEPPIPAGRRREPWGKYILSLVDILKKDTRFTRFIIVRLILNLGEMATGFYALYAVNKFSLSTGMYATFAIVLAVSQSLSNLVWGCIGDKKGFKTVLACAAVLGVASTLLAVGSTTLWMFIPVFPIVGTMLSAAQIANVNLAIEYSLPSQTQTYVGLMNTLQAPVLAVVPLVGGLIADALDYPATMLVASCLYAIGFVIALVSLKEPKDARQ